MMELVILMPTAAPKLICTAVERAHTCLGSSSVGLTVRQNEHGFFPHSERKVF
jgi:hypothetical protein